MRGLLTGFATLLLMAAMFMAVHRGARSRDLGEKIGETEDRLAVAEVRRSELAQEIEQLRSRTRIVRAAEELGFHLPSEEEFVIIDLSNLASNESGGSR